LSIFYENDLGQSFPKVSTGTLSTGQWTMVSIPKSQINPNNLVVHRISIQEVSGTTKTFYIDNLGFAGTVEQPAPDTTAPVVAFTQPAQGVTVSGTITVSASASDNVGVSGIRFLLDGTEIVPEIKASPYNATWNTSSVSNGSHVLTVVARDSANNQSSASVTVNVSNQTAPPQTALAVYEDALSSPWINASWSASITFSSTEKAFSGPASIKVVQNAWGALRVHSGPWGQPADVSGSAYETFEFSVFGGSVGVSIGVYFENDLGQSFPSLL
jgi:hypothetical protein